MKFLIQYAAITGAALLCSSAALANDTETLETVVVTASRVAQTENETLAPITVITREDIERYQATSVQDVLRRVPGAYFVNTGGQGKVTSLFLRGSESDHVLVLIDGVKVGSASVGTTSYQHLPISQIERIEVVRGPRSSLYGSDAIGGVIQIFTRNPQGSIRPYGSISVGRYDSYKANVGVGGTVGNSWFNASVTGNKTQGFDSCRSTGGTACFPEPGGEPDKDGYENISGSARIGSQLNKLFRLEATLLHADNEVEFDGGFQNESKGIDQAIGASVEITPDSNNKTTVRVGSGREEVTSFKDGVQSGRFDTKTLSGSVQHDLAIGDSVLFTVGADYEDDQVSTTSYGDIGRYDRAVFAQTIVNADPVDMQLSFRNNDNEQFGSANTGNLALGLQITDVHRITASTGQAFKAPTFNELYFAFFGDPNLQPERSRNYEVGYQAEFGVSTVGVTAYHSKITNLIAFDSNVGLANNIDSARIRGVEFAASTEWNSWLFNITASRVDTRDESGGAADGNELVRRARYIGTIDIDRSFGEFSLGASLYSASRTYIDTANTRQLGSYGLVDLRGSLKLNQDWSVDARLSNVGDKKYETVEFYNQPGAALNLTLRYQPQ